MGLGVDPFGETCDPQHYVPRLGTEAALAVLRGAFAAGRLVSVLSGPPGLGKTMVLRVLATQLAGARSTYLAYAALGIEELALVALDGLGERAPGDRASVALAAAARRDPARPLVLLVDDASALPPETARALRELADALGGALRVVAAAVDDARSAAAIAALGDGIAHARLREPLSPKEVRAYLGARTARAALAELALSEEQIEHLTAETRGVPREINTFASALLVAQRRANERVAGLLEEEG